MDWLYEKSPEPGGGKASSGGSSFHVSFRSGSRGMGSCAGASHDYITRECMPRTRSSTTTLAPAS
jgi:hypothetical protein